MSVAYDEGLGVASWQANGWPLDWPVYTIGSWSANITDTFGVDWVVETEDGWSGSPAMRVTTQDRERQDGSYDGPGYFGSRLIQLAGTALAPSRLAMLAAKRRFAAVCSGRDRALLVVEESDMTLQSLVRRAAENKATDHGARAFKWSLQLSAPDPRKYAAYTLSNYVLLPDLSGPGVGRTYPRTYPMRFAPAPYYGQGRLTVNVPGTYEVGALLTVSGPVTNPAIEHTGYGRTLALGYDLLAGQTVVFDLSTRRVYLDGTGPNRADLLTSRGWWLFGAGTHTLRFHGTGPPTATLGYTLRPAYI